MQSVGLALGGTVRGWEHIGVILAFAEKKTSILPILQEPVWVSLPALRDGLLEYLYQRKQRPAENKPKTTD